MVWIIERIKYEYLLSMHQSKVTNFELTRHDKNYKAAYYHIDSAINYGARAVVVCRRMERETVHLREALRHLKKVRGSCLELMSHEDLSDVIRSHPYIQRLQEKLEK